MLEAQAVQRVVQLDVDAEVVAVELELVARGDALVLGDVERERRDRAVEGELPVVVALGLGSARLWRTLLPEVSMAASARA